MEITNHQKLIMEKLKLFNYNIKNEDYTLFEFLLAKAINSINIFCNRNYNENTIPKALDFVLVDRAVAEFLEHKKMSGNLEGFNFNGQLKKLTLGDTTEEYDLSKNPETTFESIIKNLKISGKNELIRFRRLG